MVDWIFLLFIFLKMKIETYFESNVKRIQFSFFFFPNSIKNYSFVSLRLTLGSCIFCFLYLVRELFLLTHLLYSRWEEIYLTMIHTSGINFILFFVFFSKPIHFQSRIWNYLKILSSVDLKIKYTIQYNVGGRLWVGSKLSKKYFTSEIFENM